MTVLEVSRRDYVSFISLRLRHPDADLERLLSKWGFVVGRAWMAGDERTTPKGNPLNGVWSESYAYTELLFPEQAGLAASLEQVVGGLETCGQAIAKFVDDGGYAELFVGWAFEGNSGDELGWKLLSRLANMRLTLSLDVLPPPSSED